MICAGSDSNGGQVHHSPYITIPARVRSINERKKTPGLLTDGVLGYERRGMSGVHVFEELSEAGAFSLLHLLFPAVHIHVHTHTHTHTHTFTCGSRPNHTLSPAFEGLSAPGLGR